MMPRTRILLSIYLSLLCGMARAQETLKYRTDDSADKSLPWFQLVDGEFPPENSAHYVSGELIKVDHLERTFTLRGDRNDERGNGDYPIDAAMLPYGSIYYHGAPADLKDIPLGTHLHGWFYQRPEQDRIWTIKNGRVQPRNNSTRQSLDVDFTRCLRLEDEFSHHTRQNQTWKIDTVDLTEKKLTATLQQDGKKAGEPISFDLQASTTVFQGNGFATLKDIKPGQQVQMNLTWATLFGKGRVTAIWLDEASRQQAAARQRERHRDHIRDHGLPGFVTAVDDKKRVVTITFFDSVDPELFKELPLPNPKPLGWPTQEYNAGNLSPKGNICVARESLMTYDQVNDRKGGNILKIEKITAQPGSSGVQIQVQCGILLEGFRPKKVIRFFPATWPVGDLPKEEGFYGRE
ncbi:MAG: hypothetical protein WD768_01770 [Phycisphaeraceae bacterium]